MEISTIICTKNRSEDLKYCFDSIIKQLVFPDEVIVVDSSTDKRTEKLCNEYKKYLSISLSYIHTSPGLTKQRNIGIKRCNNEIIAFIDDDVILEKCYFKEIKKAFLSSENVLGVGGNIVNVKPDKMLQYIIKKVFLLSEFAEDKGIMKKSGFARFPYGRFNDSFLPTQILVGCSSSFRRYVLNDSKFDEFFEGYSVMEDVELSYRISKKGQLIYWPAAKLIHKKSPIDRNSTAQRYEMLIINHFYVFKKIVKKFSSDWFYFYWSHFGISLQAILISIKFRTFSPVLGIFSAYKKVYNNSQ